MFDMISKRVVFLDSDMIVMRNMDELMLLELPKDWIAAAHTCACNPYKSYFYPEDWYAARAPQCSLLNENTLTNKLSNLVPLPLVGIRPWKVLPAHHLRSSQTLLEHMGSSTPVYWSSRRPERSLQICPTTSPIIPTSRSSETKNFWRSTSNGNGSH